MIWTSERVRKEIEMKQFYQDGENGVKETTMDDLFTNQLI